MFGIKWSSFSGLIKMCIPGEVLVLFWDHFGVVVCALDSKLEGS